MDSQCRISPFGFGPDLLPESNFKIRNKANRDWSLSFPSRLRMLHSRWIWVPFFTALGFLHQISRTPTSIEWRRRRWRFIERSGFQKIWFVPPLPSKISTAQKWMGTWQMDSQRMISPFGFGPDLLPEISFKIQNKANRDRSFSLPSRLRMLHPGWIWVPSFTALGYLHQISWTPTSIGQLRFPQRGLCPGQEAAPASLGKRSGRLFLYPLLESSGPDMTLSGSSQPICSKTKHGARAWLWIPCDLQYWMLEKNRSSNCTPG